MSKQLRNLLGGTKRTAKSGRALSDGAPKNGRCSRPRREWVERTIRQARQQWAYPETWEVTWEWKKGLEVPADISGLWTEQRAHIRVSADNTDKQRLRRDLYHELGHPIVAPIWRGVSDWAEHMIKDPKERAIFEEMVNTRENEVLDYIVSQIFKI